MFWKKDKHLGSFYGHDVFENGLVKETQEERKQISCEECKCLLYIEDAKKVNLRVPGYLFSELLYCHACKPPYDEKTRDIDTKEFSFFKNERLQVDEKGNWIAKGKIKY